MSKFPAIHEDAENRFRRHLSNLRDVTLIVLKGHLLAEEQLNEWLSLQLSNPGALTAGRFSFSQRLCLARALVRQGHCDDLFDHVGKLNTLRNKFAHRLEPDQLDLQIKNFLRGIESPAAPVEEFEKEPTSRRLKRCIALLCGQLAGMREGAAVIHVERVRK